MYYKVLKDNKVIDYKMETLTEKDLNKFLKKNGLQVTNYKKSSGFL